MDRDELAARGQMLRTPRAAGVAGLSFSVLMGAFIVLITLAVPSAQTEPGAWLTDPERRSIVVVGLNLIPFAGIAFLWFMGVVRDRIGQQEDRFFATVFLGSGLLFVALLFAAAAVAGAAAAAAASGGVSASELSSDGRIARQLLTTYALRMAAVFVISTTTIALRTAILPRWLALVGYGVALALLANFGLTPFINLVFPLWTLALSIQILLTVRKREGASGGS